MRIFLGVLLLVFSVLFFVLWKEMGLAFWTLGWIFGPLALIFGGLLAWSLLR